MNPNRIKVMRRVDSGPFVVKSVLSKKSLRPTRDLGQINGQQ
jgi:hypothetical protein